MNKILATAALALAALLIASADSAQAQGVYSGYVGGCNSCGNGFGLGSPYALGRVPDPPYFALHPPVYYSAPVPRSYGYSPFAYPGSVRTPDVVMEGPAEVKNPHVESTRMQKPKAKKATPLNLTQKRDAQLLMNPFVNQRFANN